MNNRVLSDRIYKFGMVLMASGSVLATMVMLRLLDGAALIPSVLPLFVAAGLGLASGLLILRAVRQGKFDVAPVVVRTKDDYRLARIAERTDQTTYDPVQRHR
jgi:hypothetical protein